MDIVSICRRLPVPPQSPSSPRFIPRQNPLIPCATTCTVGPVPMCIQSTASETLSLLSRYSTLHPGTSILEHRSWNLDDHLPHVCGHRPHNDPPPSSFDFSLLTLQPHITQAPFHLLFSSMTLPLTIPAASHSPSFPRSVTHISVSRPSKSHMHPAIMSMSMPLQHSHTPKS